MLRSVHTSSESGANRYSLLRFDGRLRSTVASDTRGMIDELGGRALRVVTLEDGETVHNAFPSRVPKDRRGRGLKLHYYPETDSLYIDLGAKPSVESNEIAGGVVVDFDADGNVVGIDIERASIILDLKRLEVEGLPLIAAS